MKRSIGLLACLATGVITVSVALAATRAQTARIVGRIELCGGLPGPCRAANGRVTVRNSQGHRVATHRTKHSRFSFTVAPGSYTLIATWDGRHTSSAVHATANKTTRANITFALK